MTYIGCIGLEIHIALKTKTKLFCACPMDSTQAPNSNVCPVCLGHPGVLPRLNRAAVEQGLKIATALNMAIPEQIRFDRKHYVYPDLSKNFQTSQFYFTLGTGGTIDYQKDSQTVSVPIAEAHLEEDAAKLIHQDDESLVDYNRGGTPLLEMVTQPALHSGAEAELLLRNLRLLLRRIGASDANMEMAQMRCDANVSVSPDGLPTGTRAEIKNINSARFVRMAIEHEIVRQNELLARGGRVVQETRLWNENRGITESMRSKESAHDYRYLAEPDLPVVKIPTSLLAQIKGQLPELPEAQIARYVEELHLTYQEAWKLLNEPDMESFFLKSVKLLQQPRLIYSWLTNQLTEVHKEAGLDFKSTSLTPAQLVEVIRLKEEGGISSSNAKILLKLLLETRKEISLLMKKYNLLKVSDEEQIQKWVLIVLDENAEAVDAYLAGKKTIFAFLKGQTLKLSKGKADPSIVDSCLNDRLADLEEKE